MAGALDKAISVSQPAIRAYVERVRRSRPDASPAEVIAALNRYFLSTVSTSGGLAGAAAFAPVGAGVAAGALDLVGFTAAAAMHVLAVAEVHGVEIHDLERRRTVVLAALLGDVGSRKVLGAVG